MMKMLCRTNCNTSERSQTQRKINMLIVNIDGIIIECINTTTKINQQININENGGNSSVTCNVF